MRSGRTSLAVASLLLLLAARVGLGAKPGSSQDPAVATFGDRRGDKILSDGSGPYDDADQCVIAWVDSASGQLFFRSASPICNREIVLNFGDALSRRAGCNCSLGPCHEDDAFNQAGTLDICGANTVLDVRWLADRLFHSAALTGGTPLTLRINLAPDFRYTAFELQFEQAVPVTGGATTRVMAAGSNAVAELYRFTGKGGQKVSLGRFCMPFELTVTR